MLSWTLWVASIWQDPAPLLRRYTKGFVGPMLLGGGALLWGIVQITPFVPASWAHPVWHMVAAVLGTHPAATISVDPWRTGTEVMKLATYAMALCLTRAFASRDDRAEFLLDALIVIGGCYAAYALAMAASGIAQFNVFYSTPAPAHDVAAPFVNHNSLASYAGLTALASGTRLVEKGGNAVIARRGVRVFTLTLIHYLFGRGVHYLVAAALSVAALFATGSRAGNAAFIAGMIAIFALAFVLNQRKTRRSWTLSTVVAVLAGLIFLFTISGASLKANLIHTMDDGLHADTRLMLWRTAFRMIHSAPFFGLGLGTFVDAYPMYSNTMMRFIMDKAHNDYLELAAGWGLPAAIMWWSALCWLVILCVKGVFQRRRRRVYPMLAVGATTLVAVHSAFDFPLQMPAIALLYTVILGIGVGQCFPTRDSSLTCSV